MTLLTVQQAADSLGVSRQAIYQMTMANKLPTDDNLYNTVLIDSEVIEAERLRRMERCIAQLDSLGYEVVVQRRND